MAQPSSLTLPIPSAGRQPAPNGRLRPAWLPVALIAGATIAAYADSLGGKFLFDDTDSILRNGSIRTLWRIDRVLSPPRITGWTVVGRPVLNLSLAINYAISGTDVWSYHALNLIIHMGAALALFGVARRTLRLLPRLAAHADAAAGAIALIWAVHPVQTEGVAYVIQRAESMMGLFYLITFYAFVRAASAEVAEPGSKRGDPSAGNCEPGHTAKGIWLGVSVLACLLGMGTKEVMVTAPVMVLVYDRTFLTGSFGAALRKRAPYYAALAGTWLLLAFELIDTGGNRSGSKGFNIGVPWGQWALSQFEAVVQYLRLAVWPHPLVFNYGPIWPTVGDAAPYAVAVLALGAASLWGLIHRRPWGFLGFWFFGILAVTSLVPGNGEMIAERRMYLPLAAVLALIIPPCFAWAGRRTWPICGALAVLFAALTGLRNPAFANETAIWHDTYLRRPQNPYAQYMQGVPAFDAARLEDAIPYFRRAIQLLPDFPEAHHSLANALFRTGHVPEALAEFRIALAQDPDNGRIHYDLGTDLLHLGRLPEAAAELKESIRLDPSYSEAYDNLGVVIASLGQPRESLRQFEAALRVDPGNANAHHNLGLTLANLGDTEAANAELAKAAALGAR